LLLAPEEDSNFSVDRQRKLAEKLDAEFRTIRGAGHSLPLDSPWRVAAQATLDFLARRSPSVPAAVPATNSRS
jgi:pimeloyl-ACP methyl ester carboxylesterase